MLCAAIYIPYLFACACVGVSNTSEESFRSNPGTLALAYQFIVDTVKNYETSTVPYLYVIELSR